MAAFYGRNFQMHFHEKKLYFDLNFTGICDLRLIDKYSSLDQVMVWCRKRGRGRLNIKISFYQYRDYTDNRTYSFIDRLIFIMEIPIPEKTHWGRVTHICVGNLTIIGSDNGLSPDRCQAIILTNAGISLIGPIETNFQRNCNRNSYIFIPENAFENVVWKMAAILARPKCVKTQSRQLAILSCRIKRIQCWF